MDGFRGASSEPYSGQAAMQAEVGQRSTHLNHVFCIDSTVARPIARLMHVDPGDYTAIGLTGAGSEDVAGLTKPSLSPVSLGASRRRVGVIACDCTRDKNPERGAAAIPNAF
jgi:hypothetical protein